MLAAVAVALGLLVLAAPRPGTILPIEDVSPSVIFLDEFEDGGLTAGDVPPGRWDGLDAVPGTGAGVSSLAARSGNRGLRITDNTNLPGTGTTVAPYVSLGPGDGDRYLRAWVRVPNSADSGVTTILQLLYGPRAVADVTLAYPPGGILLAAETAGGGYPVAATGYVMGPGWRLLEVGVTDAGTNRSTHRLWVDTALAGQQMVDQSGWTVDELDIGEPWADDGTFQGVIDFDGVAVTLEPPPSHVVVDAGNVLVAGQCQPALAQLYSSSGAPAGALRFDTLTLVFDGGTAPAAMFTDPGCSTAGSSLNVDAGTVEVGFGIIGLSPGTLVVSAASSDLYGYPAFLTVLGTADGGTDGGFSFDAGFDGDAGNTGTTDAGGGGTTGDGGTAGGDGGSGNLVTDAGNEGDGGQTGGEQLPPSQVTVCGCGAAGGPWSGLGVLALLALGLRRSSAPAAPRRRPLRGTSGRRSRTARCGG